MKRILHAVLGAWVSSALALSAVLAAPTAALGSVSYAQGARLGLEAAIPGATVFAGDKVTTASEGKLV